MVVLPTKVGHNAWKQTALLIELTYKNDPKCISADVAKVFYELVKTNQNAQDFVVIRSKPEMHVGPDMYISDKACFVDFIYDVELSGQHLCTVFRFDTVYGNLNFYDIEFQKQYYNDKDLTTWVFNNTTTPRKYKSIGDMVAERWASDEEKRKTELKQKTNEENLAFINSFSTNER